MAPKKPSYSTVWIDEASTAVSCSVNILIATNPHAKAESGVFRPLIHLNSHLFVGVLSRQVRGVKTIDLVLTSGLVAGSGVSPFAVIQEPRGVFHTSHKQCNL